MLQLNLPYNSKTARPRLIGELESAYVSVHFPYAGWNAFNDSSGFGKALPERTDLKNKYTIHGYLLNGTSELTIDNTEIGKVYSGNGSSNKGYNTYIPTLGSSDFSYLCVFKLNSVTGTQILFGKFNESLNPVWLYGSGLVLDGTTLRAVSSVNNSAQNAAITGLQVNTWYVALAVKSGTTIQLHLAIASSLKTASAACSNSPQNYSTGFLGTGHAASSFNAACNAKVALFALFSKALDKRFAIDPWKIFAPQKRVVYFNTAGTDIINAPGSTLTATSSIIPGTPTAASAISGTVLETLPELLTGSVNGNTSLNGVLLTESTYIISESATGNVLIPSVLVTSSATITSGAASAGTVGNAAGTTLNSSSSIIPGIVQIIANVSGDILTSTPAILSGVITGSVNIAGVSLNSSTGLVVGAASSSGVGNASGTTVTASSSIISGNVSVIGTALGVILEATNSIIAGNATIAANISGSILTNTTNLISGNSTGNASISGSSLQAATTIIAGVASISASIIGSILNSTTTLVNGIAESVLFGNANGSNLVSTTSIISGVVNVSATVSGKLFTLTPALISGYTAVADSLDLLNKSTGSSNKHLLSSRSVSSRQATKHYEH